MLIFPKSILIHNEVLENHELRKSGAMCVCYNQIMDYLGNYLFRVE
jgi:hypothetical protein